MYNLDLKDKKIIEVLADNGNMSYSGISKLTKISKDSVKARIENLLKEQYILSFFPNIDYSKLNLQHFHIYIKFGSIINESRFVQIVNAHLNVIALTKVIGEYDYEIQLLAKNNLELYEIINSLVSTARTAITKIHPIISVEYHEYTMQIEKKPQKIKYKNKAMKYQPDKKDIEILNILSENSRESSISISKKIKISPEMVRYRIKKLHDSRIITSFHARTNKHRQGLHTYILLLNIRSKILSKDISFFKNESNIYFAKSTLGDWNLILSFHAKDNETLIKTMSRIHSNFKWRLNSASLVILLDRYKYLPMPSAIDI